MKILGIGNAIVDVLCNIENSFLKKNKLIKGSMKLINQTEFNELRSNLKINKVIAGGSVANSVVGLSFLGEETSFIGRINDDKLGNEYEEDLKKQKVNFCFKKKKEKILTGACLILITPDKERTMCTYLGLSAEISENNVNINFINNNDLIIIEGYLLDCKNSKNLFKKLFQNPKKKIITLSDKFCVDRHKLYFQKLIKNYVDITFSNEKEILSLCNTQDLKKAINLCKDLKKNFVITRSEKGSLSIFDGRVEECKAKKNLKIVDLTGAGDLFLSGFVHGYINKKNILECLHIGTNIASKIIQKVGARL